MRIEYIPVVGTVVARRRIIALKKDYEAGGPVMDLIEYREVYSTSWLVTLAFLVASAATFSLVRTIL